MKDHKKEAKIRRKIFKVFKDKISWTQNDEK